MSEWEKLSEKFNKIIEVLERDREIVDLSPREMLARAHALDGLEILSFNKKGPKE